MDMPAILTIVGVVVTAILGYFGVRYTARASRSAQELAAQRALESERLKIEAESYARARQNYDAALSTMQGEIEALKNGRAYDRSEHDRQISELKGRVRELEESRRMDDATITTLVAYIRALLIILRENAITYPPPPPDLHAR